ncbi:MAG: hypothetical protein ACXWDN_21370 [Limisphaerales bacterium]
MPTPWSSQLLAAMHKRQFVRFERRFEDSAVRGYVLDVGPKFFLLALVSDRIWFDGFECFRVDDVRGLRPDPHTRFAESALRKRHDRLPLKPRVSVRSIEELLVSASRLFPLVTVHREAIDPDMCWIGRILGVERSRVSLLEITPDATWEEKPESFRLSEITRVNFGGDYETALHLVGGDPGHPIQTVQRSVSTQPKP